MEHSAAIGAGRNPPFGGGSLSSSRIFLYRHYGIRIVWGKPRKTKEFKEYGAGTPPRFFMEHPPPLSLYQKIGGPQFHEKHPKFARQTGSENRVARYVE